MGDIYEDLEQLFGDQRREGMTTLDMMRLPVSVRTVVQLMLRNRAEITYQALVENLDKMPGDRRVDQAELDEILDAMTRLELITREERKGNVKYKLNLGPSSGGRRDPSDSEGQTGESRDKVDEVWDALDSGEIDANKPANTDSLVGRILGSMGRRSKSDE